MAEQKNNKPKLSTSDISELEELASSIKDIKDPEMQRIAKEELQGLMKDALQIYDIPPEAVTESGLAKVLQWIPGVSYIPGLVGTGIGEAALALTGNTTLDESLRRIKDAAAPDMPWVESGPFSRPALPAQYYTEKMGAMQGPYWDEQLIDSLPLSRRTAVNTGLDILKDPALLLGGMKALAGKAAPKNMEALTKQYAEEIAKLKNSTPIKNTVTNTVKGLVNPSQTIGEGLENIRFRDADLAAVDAGQRPFTKVWREHGKPGWTNRGIDLGKERIMEKSAKTVEDLVQKIPTGEDLIARAKEFYTKHFGPERTALINFDDIPEERLQIELGYLKPRSELMEPLYDAEVAKDIGTVGMTGPTIAAQKNVEDLFRETALADPGVTGRLEKAKEASKISTINRNPLTGEVEVDFNPTPGKTPPADILDFEEKFYTPEELNAAAKGLQGHAATQRANVYNRPDPTMQVLNKTEQRMNPAVQMAEGELAAKSGARARELQHEVLANINPSKGAESLKATKDMASLLRSGPFTSEKYIGSPLTSRMYNFTKRANTSPVTGAVIDALDASLDFLTLSAGKAMTSPWSVYGAQPIARGIIANQAEEERKKSPWYILNRDYLDRSR